MRDPVNATLQRAGPGAHNRMQQRSPHHSTQAAEQCETTVAISHRWPGRAHDSRGGDAAPRREPLETLRAASASTGMPLSPACTWLSRAVTRAASPSSASLNSLRCWLTDNIQSSMLPSLARVPAPESSKSTGATASPIAAEPEALTCTSNPTMSQAEAASNEEQDAGARKSFNDSFLSATIPS